MSYKLLLSEINIDCYMLIIGIAGGTGSGKTTVVNKIINSLPA